MACKLVKEMQGVGQSICEGLTGMAKQGKRIVSAVGNGIKGAANAVRRGYDNVGRKWEVICDKHLPGPLKGIAKDIYWGAPTTGILALAIPPGLGLLAAGVTLLGTRMLEATGRIKPETAERVYKGVRNFCVVGAAADVVRTGLTGNPVFLISIPFYALLGLSAHLLADTAQFRRAHGIF